MNPNIGIQFHQLPMFVTPHEVSQMKSHDFGGIPMSEVAPKMDERSVRETAGGHEYREDLDTGKLFYSAKDYLHHIKNTADAEGGIKNAIHATPSGTLVDGNHRAVVAMQTNRLMPVYWHNDVKSALKESSGGYEW
jgi:hypothetical protein